MKTHRLLVIVPALFGAIGYEPVKAATPSPHRTGAGGPQGAPPVNCFVDAKMRTLLNDEQAQRLCHCARSTRKVECFLEARRRTFLENDQAIRLCTAGRNEVFDCLID